MTTVPTTTAAATGTRPTTDNTGTLVDNGNGTYTYTFYRDITQGQGAGRRHDVHRRQSSPPIWAI